MSSKYYEQWLKLGNQLRTAFARPMAAAADAGAKTSDGLLKEKKAA
jgi:hypothetical protein